MKEAAQERFPDAVQKLNKNASISSDDTKQTINLIASYLGLFPMDRTVAPCLISNPLLLQKFIKVLTKIHKIEFSEDPLFDTSQGEFLLK